ncbi:MAG: hypothetical protein ACJ79R_12000 [Anaeromyxobacteraceae bacterium]
MPDPEGCATSTGKRLCRSLAAAWILSGPALAAEQRGPETAVVVPGARYGAGWLHRLLFGGQWRDDWTTPIRVATLDLSSFDGGIEPVRRGGGQQTRSLRLKSANGNSWAFRSVDKDPTRVLDPELRASKVADLLRDVTSTSHPMAALVVAPLLEAAGVLHATPQVFVMPDDARLGEFRDFAGLLGTLELRPGVGYAGANKASATLALFARLEARSDERVDARAYLRARLMDLLVGDWDRHVDQWRWLRFDEDGERVWRPVPRDRDQAFARFDGVFPSVAEYYTKQIASFGDGYPAIDKLTYSGRYIDRRFLVQLERAEWQAVAGDVVARLTDDVLADAVRHLPPELHATSGARIEEALRARRDALRSESDAFYALLAQGVDVHGTEQDDCAVVRRAGDGTVEVTLAGCDPARREAVAPPYFHRTFRPGETAEVRLYLHGGADRVVEEGERDGTIRVRTVRGDPDGGAAHQAPAGTSAATPGGRGDEEADAEADELRRRYEVFRDWGADWLVFPQLSYDGTRGLFAGARLQLTEFGFGREPFADQMSFAAAWSTALSQPRLEYRLDVRTRSSVGMLAYVAYSGVDLANFFGLGNQTVRDAALASRDFYRVPEHHLVVRPLATATLAGDLRGRAGAAFEYFSNEADRPTAASGTYGSGKMALASAELSLAVDTRSGALTERRGVAADVSVRYFPAWLDNAAAFTKARAEAAVLLGSDFGSPVLLGVRVAGEKNWGRSPFFEAAFIGGDTLPSPLDVTGTSRGNLLHGYDLGRFAGDASLVANADLRVPLGRYSAILPLRYGLLGVADVGRVFLSGETSSRWHTGAGGGAWLALRAAGTGYTTLVASLSLMLVRSEEGTSFYFSGAFGL